MKLIRTAGLAFVAVFAVGAAGAPSALAHGGQEFIKLGAREGFTGTSGVSVFETPATAIITCKRDTVVGDVNGKARVAKVVVKFLECEGEDLFTHEKCSVKSEGAGAGNEIVTKELQGELGHVEKAEAATEVGLLLEGGGTNKEITTFEGTCLVVSTQVTGTFAGEVEPIGAKVEEAKLRVATSSGKQKIKKIWRSGSGAEVKPSITAFGLTTTMSTLETLKFEEGVTITLGT
jgi:hypothetical protein